MRSMTGVTYSPELAAEICRRIALGESLRAICKDGAMPSQEAVYSWLRVNAAFREQYVRAREDQAEFYLDEIIAISDDTTHDTKHTDSGEQPNSEWISRSRLRVDARKWAMSKLAPKKYGDKIDLTTGGESLNLTAEDRAAKLLAIQEAAARRRAEQEDGEDLL
jgi:hypothetical protein